MALSYELQILCNILSTTVITTGLILKFPQIFTIFKAGNSKGVSFSSVLLEECAYSVMLTYNFASGYPLMTYIEYTVLVLQDLLLIMLILHYNNQFGFMSVVGFMLYFLVYNCIAFRIFPDLVVNASVSLVLPLSVTSKVAQIKTLYTKKDSGQLSLLTWSIAAYGCIARVVTTSLQTRDLAILANFSFSGLLNIIIVTMIIIYRPKKDKLY